MGNEPSGNIEGNMPTMTEDITGTIFDEEMNSTDISSKYHNLKGRKGTADLDINSLADKVKKIVNDGDFSNLDEMYAFDEAFGLETYIIPYENQVINRINKTFNKNGTITSEDVVDSIIESYIYQYNKYYKNQRDFNKFLRHDFKNDLMSVINK